MQSESPYFHPRCWWNWPAAYQNCSSLVLIWSLWLLAQILHGIISFVLFRRSVSRAHTQQSWSEKWWRWENQLLVFPLGPEHEKNHQLAPGALHRIFERKIRQSPTDGSIKNRANRWRTTAFVLDFLNYPKSAGAWKTGLFTRGQKSRSDL